MKQKMNGTAIASMIMKIVVVVGAIAGTVMSAIGSRDSFMGGKVVFMYFTTQSNLLVALISILGLVFMFCKKSGGRIEQIVKIMGASAISLTCFVYCFLLAPTIGEEAWKLNNFLTHVLVPSCFVTDFFMSDNRAEYKREDSVWTLVLPLLYVAYAGIGYACGWHFSSEHTYPYFFLNWGSKAGAFGFINEAPYFGCAWWILILLVFMLLIGIGYIAIANKIYNKRYNKPEAKPIKKKNWFKFD